MNLIKDLSYRFQTIHGMAMYYIGGFLNVRMQTCHFLHSNSSIDLICPKGRMLSSFVNSFGSVKARRNSISKNLHETASCYKTHLKTYLFT